MKNDRGNIRDTWDMYEYVILDAPRLMGFDTQRELWRRDLGDNSMWCWYCYDPKSGGWDNSFLSSPFTYGNINIEKIESVDDLFLEML